MEIQRNKRETGFEILRILAMFLIGAIHVINYGGMLKNNSSLISIVGQKLIYAFFTMSVNVFVLISAYFMVNSKFKIKKIILLWIQVLTFSVISYLIASLIIYNNFSFRSLIKCFFPIICNKYWFFTSYFLLILISPLLNKILHNSTKKELYITCLLLFLITCFSSYCGIGHITNLNAGYSFLWFVVLYIFTGTLKLYPLKLKKLYIFIIYISSVIITWIAAVIGFNALQYISPLVIVSSISIFLLFENINIKNIFIHNSICFISSLTFGIYLFQESAIKPFLYFNILKVQRFYNSDYSPLAVLMFALLIFVFGAIIELVRKYIEKLVVFTYKKVKSKLLEKKYKNSKVSTI